MEGKLLKWTKGKGVSGNTQWIERYYILNMDSKELTFYQENKGKRSYRGQVNVENGIVSQSSEQEKPYAFQLVAKNSSGDEEIMNLAAPTKDEMIDWVSSLSHCALCDSEWISQVLSSRETDMIGQKSPIISTFESTQNEVDNFTTQHKEPPTGPEVSSLLGMPDDNLLVSTQESESRTEIQESTIEPTTESPQTHPVIQPEKLFKEDNQPEKIESIPANGKTQREAPLLRASSGYDFGSRVPKVMIPPQTISEEVDSPSWEFICHFRRTIPRIGKKLLKRCHLYEKLHSSLLYDEGTLLFEFQSVKELLAADNLNDPDSSSEILISFPYLSSSGCTWDDILKYLRFTERSQENQGQSNSSNFHLEFECLLRNKRTAAEFQFDWVTYSTSWLDELSKKILSLKADDLDDEERILKLVTGPYCRSLSEVIHSHLEQYQTIEEYVLRQEKDPPSKNIQHIEEGSDEFDEADLNRDGHIDREEWRNWMLEKEEIIKNCNDEKSKLIQENQNLRKALNSSALQIFNELQAYDERTHQLQIDLADAQVEIEKLKLELSLCHQQFQEADRIGAAPKRPFSTARSEDPNQPEAGSPTDYSSTDDSDSSNDSIKSLDHYIPGPPEVDDGVSEVAEADLAHLSHGEAKQHRRNSFEIVNSRPLQIRAGKTSISPSNSTNRFANSRERSAHESQLPNNPSSDDGREFDILDLSSEYSAVVHQDTWDQSPELPASWVHEYVTHARERNHLSKNDSPQHGSFRQEHNSPITLPANWSHLPPAINESLYPPEDYSPKTTLCRDTLINGREHGVISTSKYDMYQEINQYSPDHSSEKRKLHPLHKALKNNTSQLAVPTTVFSPNLSKLVTSPPSPSPMMKSKSFSREQQRSLPSSQRYLIGLTTSSANKLKRSTSSQMSAIRGAQEWK